MENIYREKFNNLMECKKLQATVRKLSGEPYQENWNKSEKLLEHDIIKTPDNGI
jgi:vacuolar-type H+-ATPase subunit C/Vma6